MTNNKADSEEARLSFVRDRGAQEIISTTMIYNTIEYSHGLHEGRLHKGSIQNWK